jgi:hypothetical protein
MISGGGTRPNDILTTSNEKTIEVCVENSTFPYESPESAILF